MRHVLFLLLVTVASAGDWSTFGGDPQRTGLADGETELTQSAIKGLKLQWKLKLDQQPVELNSLTAPVVHSQVITNKGFKEVVLVAGASDRVFAIDADEGKLLWQKQMTIEGKSGRNPHWLCPNTLNATPVIDKKTRTAYVLSSDGKLHSLILANGEDRVAPIQFVPPFSKAWSLNLYDGVIYTTTSQGCNGVKSGVYALSMKDPQHPVVNYNVSTAGAGIWGRAGVAISSKGFLLAETGDGPYDPAVPKFSDTVVELTTGDLKLKDYYTPQNRAWITKKDLDMGNMSPVIFPYGGGELAAAAGKEGVIYLLNVPEVGGADHRTPLYRSPLLTNEEVHFAGRGFWGAMSTWLDADGKRWLYAPALGPQHPAAPEFPMKHGDAPQGSVMAFTVEDKGGKTVLVPRWRSLNMSVPEPVVIANGMIFALANGENTSQVDDTGRILTSAERASKPSGHAILYALDALTGKELWSSADAIPGFTHFSAPVVSGGRVYVVTHDGMLYAFGL